MLNMLHKFVVPGVEDVDIYQDDEDPLQFWMVPQRLRLSTDADGDPSLNILAFARDLSLLARVTEPLPPGQTEGGLMGFTVECTVGQDDQRAIVDYIRGQVLSGALPMSRPVAAGGQVGIEHRQATGGDPKLAYPTWIEGDAQFSMPSALGPTFLASTENKVKPSLTSSNVASFTLALGQEGIRLVRDGVETGKLTAGVAYSLQFVARIPSISVTVTGDADDVYQEIKQHATVVLARNGTPVRTFPQVSSLEQLKNVTSSLHVEYTKFDFGGNAPDTLREKLEAMVLEITLSYLKSAFCQPLITGQLDPQKLGTDPMQFFNPPGTPVAGGNQLWLKDFKQDADFHFGMTFHGNLARPFAAYPKADLVDMLTHEQLKKSFATADLNNPIFFALDVPVRVTADFVNDPIEAITVSLDYRQTDDKTGQVKAKTETFTFDKDSVPHYFRVPVMAKDAQGVPKDAFTYSSAVHYKAAAERTVVAPRETRERSLIIGYDRLDCVDVKAVAGAVPWTTVDAIQIDFSLPGVDLPTAAQTVVLTEKQPEGAFFTYTGGGDDHREYEYTCEFFMKSGKRMTLPARRTNASRLLVDAPFEDKLVATFVPQGQFPPLRSIVLSVRYVDEPTDFRADGTHVFTSDTDVWRWEVDLPESDRRAFDYKTDITYTDGTTTAGSWQPGEEGTILIGEVKSSLLEVSVTGAVLDMTKWKLVVVRLRYEDPGTHEVQEQIVQLTAANAAQGATWKVALKDNAATGYTYQIDGYGVDGSRKTVPVTPSSDKLLVVEL